LHPNVLKSVRDRFGLHCYDVERAGGGAEADIWVARVDGRPPLCVKRFRARDRRNIFGRLQLTEKLREGGVPFPRAHRCVQGKLASSCGRRWVAITEWVDGDILKSFTPAAAESAGQTLARLHASLRTIAVADGAWKAPWEHCDSVQRALDTCLHLRRAIEQTRRPTFLDTAIYDALVERSNQLEVVDQLRSEMPAMVPQVLHGDFTRPNLLFRGDDLVAVLDLQGRNGYPMWEIGKLAFDPETLVRRSDGFSIALRTLAAYAGGVPNQDQVLGVLRMTILANLVSFWGISARYRPDGEITATGGEAYWLNRHVVARMLLAALPQVEAGTPVG
jgi:homoserine kinase type II